MHCAQSLKDWQTRNQEMTARMLRLTTPLDAEKLNARPDASLWSPAQIVEHLVLTNRPYLQVMAAALQTAPRVSEDPTVQQSFFGRILCQAAGPDGNAPAPKALHPRSTPIPISVLQEWEQQQLALMALLEKAAERDLSRIRVWNPFVRILPMNLADCFELMTVHTQRHLGQIEARLPAAS